MTNTYTEPVSKLLALGETDWIEWDDYSEFGFTQEHIHEVDPPGNRPRSSR